MRFTMKVPSASEQKNFWDDWVCRSFAWQENPDNKRRGAYVIQEVIKYNKKNLRFWMSGVEVDGLHVSFQSMEMLPQQIFQLRQLMNLRPDFRI